MSENGTEPDVHPKLKDRIAEIAMRRRQRIVIRHEQKVQAWCESCAWHSDLVSRGEVAKIHGLDHKKREPVHRVYLRHLIVGEEIRPARSRLEERR